MTLIEMLVSVSILTVMILAFSTILVQSQRVISVAQTSRRSHAMAFAIARVIRGDFRRITQSGFLAICNRTGTDEPLMVFTTAGATQGTASDARGGAGLVCYGLWSNASATDPTHKILWRPQYVLSQFAQGQDALSLNAPSQPERMNMELANVELWPRLETTSTPAIDSIVEIPYAIAGWSQPTPTIRVPPKNGNDISQLWQVLVTECSKLSITWTDGVAESVTAKGPPAVSMGYDLRWFGIDKDLPPVTAYDRTKGPRWANLADTEVSDTKYSGQFSYFALFTHENQKVWPRAVKIRFTIYEKGMPDEFRGTDGKGGMEYEVICNIGE
jgi:type II secretory pathway pseudopilin PulG